MPSSGFGRGFGGLSLSTATNKIMKLELDDLERKLIMLDYRSHYDEPACKGACPRALVYEKLLGAKGGKLIDKQLRENYPKA